MTPWTAVVDALPPGELDVLLVGLCPVDRVPRFDVGYLVRGVDRIAWNWKWVRHAPTHWRPLPPAPFAF